VLVPAGGVLLAHYVVLDVPTRVDDLYARGGPYARHGGIRVPGVVAWAAGSLTYHATGAVGSTLPALVVAIGAYAALAWRDR